MESKIEFEISCVAKIVGIPLQQVKTALKLLDDGNTVPFITRYRRDQTGGLDEQQIRAIKHEAAIQRGLVERKQTVLKAIENQGKLTEELSNQILAADSIKRVDDIYLPFKPKRQTLATIARQQGLEPLALDIIECRLGEIELATRALDFVRVDRGVENVDQVIQGVKFLIAEHYSENSELRASLRKTYWETGKLCSASIKPIAESKTSSDSNPARSTAESPASNAGNVEVAKAESSDSPKSENTEDAENQTASAESNTTATSEMPETASETAKSTYATEESATKSLSETATGVATEQSQTLPKQNSEDAQKHVPLTQSANQDSENPESIKTDDAKSKKDNKPKNEQSKQKRKSKKDDLSPFQDYFDFAEPVKSIPPHRVLAINRGERAKVLKVKVEADFQKCREAATESLIPDEAIYKDFLHECVSDALTRLIYPSLEREIRRELTEESEKHAVTVFARNLRNLLLQPPVQKSTVLAIDPGYRSGCKLAVVSEFGKPVVTELIHVVGKDDRIAAGKETLAKLIDEHKVNVIAIGNGSACRQTEKLVASVLSEKFADQKVAYVIVNESGASVYSTSAIGREELPEYDPTFRSAISIGRRLLDPLSELVKINAGNIGIGLYQHDLKAKHLHESLDEVVSSCVNFVGVDVNTASPSLLKYVSGLNQLTARRLYEYRQQNGPFKNRQEFKNVPGFGDVTYTQSAGFLRISHGDEPFDATSIHPESYEDATKLMNRLEVDLRESMPETSAETEEKAKNENDAASGLTSPTYSTSLADSSNPIDSKESAPADSKSRDNIRKIRQKVKEVSKSNLSVELGIGRHLLDDILDTLCRPGRDPREHLPKPIFRRGILKLEDLVPGMELDGRVINVVDFGAFVDIGIGNSALVHVSALSNKFVKNPHQIVAIGDTLRLWVTQVDKERRRVSLTAIQPGTENERPSRPSGSRPQRTSAQNTDRGKGKKRDDSTNQRRDRKHRDRKPKKPRAPVKPITEAMAEGREAMRTFSDLQQFFEKKDEKNKE